VDARTYDLRVSYTPDDIYAEARLNDPTKPHDLKMTKQFQLQDAQARGETLPSRTATSIKRGAPLGELRPAPGPDDGKFHGCAVPVDSRGDGGPAQAHIGSGMRIYLGHGFFNPQKSFQTSPFSMDMAETIYHELTHKVLGANDHWYGISRSRREERQQPQKARPNADNYAYLVTSLGGPVWQDDGAYTGDGRSPRPDVAVGRRASGGGERRNLTAPKRRAMMGPVPFQGRHDRGVQG
jgi:hypothetical protein